MYMFLSFEWFVFGVVEERRIEIGSGVESKAVQAKQSVTACRLERG